LWVLKPENSFLASSSLTAVVMITPSPCFQFAGVATLCLAVSWIESMTLTVKDPGRLSGSFGARRWAGMGRLRQYDAMNSGHWPGLGSADSTPTAATSAVR
jgi:hypothetical protein